MTDGPGVNEPSLGKVNSDGASKEVVARHGCWAELCLYVAWVRGVEDRRGEDSSDRTRVGGGPGSEASRKSDSTFVIDPTSSWSGLPKVPGRKSLG